MVQISSPKILSFDVPIADALNTMEDVRNYAIDKGLISIEPTRLNKIVVRLNFLNEISLDYQQRIRIFFFSNLATHQSELIRFFGKNLKIDGHGKYLEYYTEEGDFWQGTPFIIESIGISPENKSIREEIQIKVIVYKR